MWMNHSIVSPVFPCGLLLLFAASSYLLTGLDMVREENIGEQGFGRVGCNHFRETREHHISYGRFRDRFSFFCLDTWSLIYHSLFSLFEQVAW